MIIDLLIDVKYINRFIIKKASLNFAEAKDSNIAVCA